MARYPIKILHGGGPGASIGHKAPVFLKKGRPWSVGFSGFFACAVTGFAGWSVYLSKGLFAGCWPMLARPKDEVDYDL